jgi:hypothetical protein
VTASGAVRRCSLPNCPAWFDAIEVTDGRDTAEGWRRWNSLGLRWMRTRTATGTTQR